MFNVIIYKKKSIFIVEQVKHIYAMLTFNSPSPKFKKQTMICCEGFNCDITQSKVSGNCAVCEYSKPIRKPNKFDFIAYNINHPILNI